MPARIASFDDELTVNFQQDAKLPCVAVGLPQPTISWQVNGKPFKPNDRMRIMPEVRVVARARRPRGQAGVVCAGGGLVV